MRSGLEFYVDSGSNRKYPRYKVDIRAKVILRQDGKDETIHARTSHLSVGGLGLTLTKELELGTSVILEFKLPQCEVFKMPAELRYRSGFKCGFQFLEVSAEQRSLIKQFCSELPLK